MALLRHCGSFELASSLRAYFEKLKHISLLILLPLLSLTPLFSLKQISARCELAGGLDFSMALTQTSMLIRQALRADLSRFYTYSTILWCAAFMWAVDVHFFFFFFNLKMYLFKHSHAGDWMSEIHVLQSTLGGSETELREGRGEKAQKWAGNEMEICVPQASSLNPSSEESHSRVKDNLQLRDASLAWPKPQL